MAQAISQLHSTETIDFGLYLADLAGFSSGFPGSLKSKNPEDALIESYQSTLIKKATSSYDWQKFSKYLKVSKTKNNKIVVYVDGPSSVVESAQMLEYGTPGKPASPLMRTTEATFNSDFESKRMFKL